LKLQRKQTLKSLLIWLKSKDLPSKPLKKLINLLMSKLLPQEQLKKQDNSLTIKLKWPKERLHSLINTHMFGSLQCLVSLNAKSLCQI